MFPPSCPPACLKRKTSSTHSASNKRIRLSGVFSPRLIVPTGARRTWGFNKPPRFILDPIAVQGAKRTLAEDEDKPTPSNCKVRLLDNRDALFLPSYKRLPTKKERKRSLSTTSPSKKSLEVVRLRRREQFKRQLQRVDSGISMDSDEDLDLDTAVEGSGPFYGFAFTGLTVDMDEAMEATATNTTTEGDDMDIEDVIISTDTTTTAASSEGDTDPGSVSAEQAISSSKEEETKDMIVDEARVEVVEEKEAEGIKIAREDDRDSGIDVELSDAEKDTEQKEVDAQLSPKDTPAKEKSPKRLSISDLITPTKTTIKKEGEEADDEDDEPPRRSTRRRSVKPAILPTTVEEEEEEDKEGTDVVKRRTSKSTIKEEEEVESEKETEKEEKKEKKKLVRRKTKIEEAADSEASDNDVEKKPKKKAKEQEEKEQEKEQAKGGVNVEKEEEKEQKEEREEEKEETTETDKMEEDTEEILRHILEDTDMSTDEDYVPAVVEQTSSEDSVVIDSPAEEDVTMSEDEDTGEEIIEDISAEQLQNEAKQEIHAATNKAEESKGFETADVVEDSPSQAPIIEVKKTVSRLVFAPSRMDDFEMSKMVLSVPKTPRTPRSPSMSRFNITMSKAPRKLEPILSPRRKKFGKFEDLTPHWTLKRLAAKKRQSLPFNPANISRHAYRDPISFWDDEDDVDDQYQRADWPLKTWGASSWVAENGGALIEFCVRQLESFNMAW